MLGCRGMRQHDRERKPAPDISFWARGRVPLQQDPRNCKVGRSGRLSMNSESVLEIEVQGTSMRPLLPPGSGAIVQRCPAARLQVGDIALFRSGRALVIHRVVALQGDRDNLIIAERGDWAAKERWRPAWQVVGRVVAVKLRRGYLELDRPSIKRIVAISGIGTSLRNAPAIVKRIAIPVIAMILKLPGILSFNAPMNHQGK